MNRFNAIAFVVGSSCAAVAMGHGVQIQTTFNPAGGKIETRRIVHSNGAASPVAGFARGDAVTSLTRVYVMPLVAFTGGAGQGVYSRPTEQRNAFGVLSYPSGPGFSWRYEYQTPGFGWEWGNASNPPANPALANLAGSTFTLTQTQPLLWWDGLGFVDPGAEQIELLRGDATGAPAATAVTTDAGPFASLVTSTTPITSTSRPSASSTSVPHQSLSYRLLGDGITAASAGDDGIYLLGLQLSSNATYNAGAAVVGASEPFYFVLYQNTSRDLARDVAMQFAGGMGIGDSHVQVVPEPAFVGFAGVMGLALTRRRR